MNQIIGKAAACLASLTVFFGASAMLSAAEDDAGPPAEGIQDNSFFVEEAYNQEPGVVQHIWNLLYARTRHGSDADELAFIFTQEWPVFSQAHQFSYSLPYLHLDESDGSAGAVGDIFLNYRLQALMESKTTPAIAPRFSLILPTGDEEDGFGTNELGYQFNLPVSKIVSDRWTLHFNAGATFSPGVEGHDLDSYLLGASAIYAVSPNFNLMVETIVNWDEEVDDSGQSERLVKALISPGFRYAFNHPHDMQTVIGLAVPIGLTDDTPEIGIFVYASFEHFFWRRKGQPLQK